MKQQRCLLCGKEYSTGLHVMGCLICFPCEKKILSQSMPPQRLRRLMALYPRRTSANAR